MSSFNRKITITSAAILLPLGIVVILSFVGTGKAPTLSSDTFYEQALAAFHSDDLVKAGELIAGHEAALVNLPEGCELGISVFAENREVAKLATMAERCIAAGLAPGISHEGLAFGYSGQGRIAEAIAMLRKEHQAKPEIPRLGIALARLLIMTGEDTEAGEILLGVIRREEQWSMWFAEILKQPTLLEQPNFIAQLSQEVIKKERGFATLEAQLIDAAAKLNLTAIVSQLQARQQKRTVAADQ